MDKQEIKKIIEDNISNIGNQAPWGAALSKVLNEIVDMVGQGGVSGYLEITGVPHETVSGTKAEAAAAYGITEDELDGIMAGKYSALWDAERQVSYYPKFLSPTECRIYDFDGNVAVYIMNDGDSWETVLEI